MASWIPLTNKKTGHKPQFAKKTDTQDKTSYPP